MKKIRQKVVGSLKNIIPTITVPTAPMPVHIGYAVPMGMVCTLFDNNIILIERQAKNPNPHRYQGIPDNPFILPRQKANPVSKKPAIMRNNQFIYKNNQLRAAEQPGDSFYGHTDM